VQRLGFRSRCWSCKRCLRQCLWCGLLSVPSRFELGVRQRGIESCVLRWGVVFAVSCGLDRDMLAQVAMHILSVLQCDVCLHGKHMVPRDCPVCKTNGLTVGHTAEAST
jgi:hypothetical protein